MTTDLTTPPEGIGPDGFVIGGLGWSPWIEPLRVEELTETHIDALVEPSRAESPYFRLLARDPAALKARTLTDLDIFYNADDGLPRAERELAAAATSRLNGCVFCASVHTSFAVKEDPGRVTEIERLLARVSRQIWVASGGTPSSRPLSPWVEPRSSSARPMSSGFAHRVSTPPRSST